MDRAATLLGQSTSPPGARVRTRPGRLAALVLLGAAVAYLRPAILAAAPEALPVVGAFLAPPAAAGPFRSRSAAATAASARAGRPRLGIFDAISNAFSNKDYSTSPAEYEQTNARASHVLVPTEEQALAIKAEIEAGLDFSEAAVKYSTCSSASRGGKLGKFTPGKMVAEFDDVVFGQYDTGEINPRNEADVWAPKYDVGVMHGPVKTKFGYHLIKIDSRYIAEFDFRLKDAPIVEP